MNLSFTLFLSFNQRKGIVSLSLTNTLPSWQEFSSLPAFTMPYLIKELFKLSIDFMANINRMSIRFYSWRWIIMIALFLFSHSSVYADEVRGILTLDESIDLALKAECIDSCC